jgi:hypothetical protein
MTEVYSDDSGRKEDEHIHKPILEGVSPEAREKHLAHARKRTKKAGLSDASIKKLYGERAK